ncbi:hypothetical protein [Hymenobacter metallicola]|uniref:Uncharacterized protein n=1 Tax=Hymenobacter metallicola TaxID=2563114 RepID=A0A4Z0QEK4_9BACT|nr:hypothetical protein [Hymenobacter metallicola]TGE27471.1 hypothetical protein E5K02_13930 [Hymenobacter metallicola]
MRCLLLFLFSLLATSLQAQHDVILRMDGQELKAKVLVIRPNDISYLAAEPAAAADTLRIATAEVFMVRFANGTKEVIAHAPVLPASLSEAEARTRGTRDARRYFKAPGAFWGTMGATVVSPIAGIATGAAIAANVPSRSNIVTPEPTLLQNPTYVKSYQQQAKRKKLGKAAAGFGTGMGVIVVALAVLLASATHW